MQRILVALLMAFAFGVSGCSQTGPLSLVQKDASGWSRADLNYLVQQEDLERNLEEADKVRAEKEALAESLGQQSPGILSKIDPIDPAELNRQARAERERNGEKVIQLVSHTQEENIDPPLRKTESEKPVSNASAASEFVPVQVAENPLHPKSTTVQSGSVKAPIVNHVEPPSQLVGHPLQPISENGNSQSFVKKLGPEEHADDAMEEVVEVEIKRLPPMLLAKPTATPSRSGMLAPRTKPEASVATVEWGSSEEPIGQVQLVSWEQDVQGSDQDPQQNNKAKPETEEKPKPDEFTNEDFYAAGWCKKPDCKEACVCPKVERIAVSSDANLPGTFLPAQFQAEEGPSWELPRLNMELKPLREAPMRVASAAPTLPMEKTTKPTLLPVPVPEQFSPTEDLDVAFPKAPFDFSPTGDLEIVFPAGAVEDMDRLANAVSNAAFHREANPMPAPKAALTWRQHLENTIDTIQGQVSETVDLNERQQLQGKLDLLRLLPSELDRDQQQYLNALTELLQTTASPANVDVYEAGQSLNQLRGAVAYLESVAGMKVVNANFCSKVTGFGQFQQTESSVFQAGQTVLVYCEIENHSCQPKMVKDQMMSSTRLAGSYIVYDSNHKVVQQEKFPVVEDLARKRRRDFYMHLPFVVGDLAPGRYTYQLMVDDVGGGKSASLEPALEFEVK